MDCDPLNGVGQARELESFAFDTFSNQQDDILDTNGFGIEGLDEVHLPFCNDDLWDQNLLMSDSAACDMNPVFEIQDDCNRLLTEWENSSSLQQPQKLSSHNASEIQEHDFTQQLPPLAATNVDKESTNSLLNVMNNRAQLVPENKQKNSKRTGHSSKKTKSISLLKINNPGKNTFGSKPSKTSPGMVEPNQTGAPKFSTTASSTSKSFMVPVPESLFMGGIVPPVTLGPELDDSLTKRTTYQAQIVDKTEAKVTIHLPYDQDLDSLLDELNSELFNREQLDKASYFNDICEAPQKVVGQESQFSLQNKGLPMQNVICQSQGQKDGDVLLTASNIGENSSRKIIETSRSAKEIRQTSYPISPLEQIQVSDHDYCTFGTGALSSVENISFESISTKTLPNRPLPQSQSQTSSSIKNGQGKQMISFTQVATSSSSVTLKKSSSDRPFSDLSNTIGIPDFLTSNDIASGTSYHEFLEMNVEDLKNDNETKKDSGLESGEVSDSCDSAGLYSKVPDYLTIVPVDVSISAVANDTGERCYDRLPAYVKGISDSPSSSVPKIGELVTDLTPKPSSEPTSRGRSPSKNQSLLNPSTKIKKHRSCSSTSNSSSGSYDKRARSPRKKPVQRRPVRSPSDLRSNTPSPSRDWKYRSRSPLTPPRTRPHRQDFKPKYQHKESEVEERRIIYVGKISEGTTRADLRKRFEKFGPILEISLHFRDRGDNYGFVTFQHKSDAFRAIERGNDNQAYEKVDLCFGGRRTFCKERYSDLDYAPASDDDASGSNDFDNLLKQARASLKR